MSSDLADIIRRLSQPIEPLPTGMKPVLPRLSGIRAVLFDVYGTMFITASGDVETFMSASGDVETTLETTPANAFTAAMTAAGMKFSGQAHQGDTQLAVAIEQHHERSRRAGIPYPEVDVVQVWRDALASLQEQGLVERDSECDIERLVVEYEARANSVWPMPNLRSCLAELRRAGKRLGIISNAQFYTPHLFTALLDDDADSLGFDKDLQFFSFRTGRAKPDCYLYALACQSLANMEIEPAEAVYVGNDMLNDVMPAQQVGFHTALFAGDARSLRLREADERVDGITPDLVLTDLSQLNECVL